MSATAGLPQRRIEREGSRGRVARVDEVLDKLRHDFYYIGNFSPWLDIVITLRTVKIMLTGFGAR
ncbi:MAG: hypothetical protein WA975_04795 [Mesorhizobium sp.]